MEQINVLNENIFIVGDENFPVFRVRTIVRRRENLEIPSVLIASNVEEIFAMIDVIAVLLLARKKKNEGRLRLISHQIPELRSIGARGPQQDAFPVPGLVHVQTERLVLLFIEKFGGLLAERVTPRAIGALCDLVFRYKK